jgi:3-phosphoshikimate 1-carboxyvinyltransferase
MQVSIGRSEISGAVMAPSSKSYTIRALMCASLAPGTSELVCPLAADDTEAACGVLEEIGVKVVRGDTSWSVSGGSFHEPSGDLNCRESAATLRFMTAIAAAVPGTSRLTAKPSLARRPIEPLIDALRQLHVECDQDTRNGIVRVRGGLMKGGSTMLPGNISSQYVTALLLVAPLMRDGVSIVLTTPLESRPYVEMTIECLNRFGIQITPSAEFRQFRIEKQTYKPARYIVEGDWSSVSYWLALGAVAGNVEVANIHSASLQGDKVLVDFVRAMEASVVATADSVRVARSGLKGISVDLTDCIDLLPTIAVIAALANGTTELNGIARGRLKESDRVASVRQELQRAGVTVTEQENKLIIVGGSPKGATFDSHGDHRMAMALSVLGVVCGDTVISGAECVAKTYPEYWETLKRLGGKVDISV